MKQLNRILCIVLIFVLVVPALALTGFSPGLPRPLATAGIIDTAKNLVGHTAVKPAAHPDLYTGEQFDPDLGFYYLRARYNNPDSGRFWTMDSYEGNGSDPLTLHKYLYCHANPVNGVDPSGHETLKTKLGKELHKKLGEMFIGNPPNPLRFSSRAVSTIADRMRIPLLGNIQVLLPDLVDGNTKEVYEIKPMTGYGLAGVFQLWSYLSLFHQVDPSGGWHAGTTWNPPKVVRLSLGFAFVSPPVGGMIFYEIETIQDIAKKGTRTVSKSEDGRLQQHMGIATMLSTLGGF